VIEIKVSDMYPLTEKVYKDENKKQETENILDFSNDLSNLDSFEFDENDLCLLDLDVSN